MNTSSFSCWKLPRKFLQTGGYGVPKSQCGNARFGIDQKVVVSNHDAKRLSHRQVRNVTLRNLECRPISRLRNLIESCVTTFMSRKRKEAQLKWTLSFSEETFCNQESLEDLNKTRKFFFLVKLKLIETTFLSRSPNPLP